MKDIICGCRGKVTWKKTKFHPRLKSILSCDKCGLAYDTRSKDQEPKGGEN